MQEIEVIIGVYGSNGKYQQVVAGGLPVEKDVTSLDPIMLDGYSHEEVIKKLLINTLATYVSATGGDFSARFNTYYQQLFKQ